MRVSEDSESGDTYHHVEPEGDVVLGVEVTEYVQTNHEPLLVLLGQFYEVRGQCSFEPGVVVVVTMSERHVVAVTVAPLFTVRRAGRSFFEGQREDGEPLPHPFTDEAPQFFIAFA
jgi:hypothetical protein